MKVLVCGGRDFDDYDFLEHALNEISKEVGGISFIVNGACDGADKHSSKWAESHGVHYVEMPALWKYNGKSAGPKRNRAMVECIDLDVIVAFPGGKGTEDMVKLGYGNDIEVIDLRDAEVQTEPEETEWDKLMRTMETSNDEYGSLIEVMKKKHRNVPPDDNMQPYVFPVPPTLPSTTGIPRYETYCSSSTPTKYDTVTLKEALDRFNMDNPK